MSIDPRLIERLLAEDECEWIEYKASWFEPAAVGRYVSALANGARLEGEPYGYLLWGVNDARSVIGTSIDPSKEKVGGQPFEFWLKGRIAPKGHGIRFISRYEEQRIHVLEVEAAQIVPVRFENVPYIRVGSATPALHDHPDRERRLLESLVKTTFENECTQEHATSEEVLELLDVDTALRLLKQQSASDPVERLGQLARFGLIEERGNFWAITNRAAVLFARRLEDFGSRFERRAARVIFYPGETRVQTQYEQTGTRGYALGFEGMFGWLEISAPAERATPGRPTCR